MQPEIFGINSYAAANVIAYGGAVLMGVYLALKDGRELRDCFEVSLVTVLSAVLGAKVFHTLFEAKGHRLPDGSTAEGLLDLLKADPWHWARLFESGYVFYGGVIGALVMGYLFTVRAGIERKGAIGDYAAFGLAFGIFVGRLGCFLAGCCYGSPTDVAWAVQFPDSHPSHGALIHPVQLYDASFGAIAFLFALWYYPRRRFDGDLFGFLVVGYAVFRFLTETLRADSDRGVWLGGLLSTSQIVSLVVLPTALFFWLREAKRTKAKATASAGEEAAP